MFAPRWRKVIRDLWINKTRTLLVVFSIAIGVAAIGIVASTRSIISRELPARYNTVNPANARISTSAFDDGFVKVVQNMDDVKEAEGRFSLPIRLKTGPDTWRDLQLFVIPDYNNIRINKIWPVSGDWPPSEGEMLVERASLAMTNAQVGEKVWIETPGGKRREILISGLVHDLNVPPGTFTNQANGYISFDTLEWLGYPRNYNELLVTTEGVNVSRAYVRRIINEVQDKVEKSGRPVYWAIVPEPGKHWFEPYLNPMATILAVLGVVILLISGFLVINTITALLAQQTRQIGIMKAVGARTIQIIWMYEVSMILIGLLSLALAIPMSILGTRWSIGVITGIINFSIQQIDIPISVIRIQIVLSLLVPMLTALFPIIAGARLTVRETITNYGISSTNFGKGLIDRLIGSVRGLPRPLLLSLRNTFRRKKRLALTLITLTLGSGIFIAVLSVNAGLIKTLDEALAYYGFDIVINLSHPYRIEQIQTEVARVPGVAHAETWGFANTRIIKADGSETNSVILVAPPPETELINPTLLTGRWLAPQDEQAAVINTDVLRESPNLKIGDKIDLKIDGDPTTWQIVGIVRSAMSGPMAYVNYPHFARVSGRYGLASAVYIATDKHDRENQTEMAKVLEDHFERVGIRVSSTGKVAELRMTAIRQFNVIFLFLLVMAALLTLVGGFGLMGTMSLNVLERTREIGVMRAIGASDGSILQIVITEGVLIGILSWIFGAIAAYPISKILSDSVGRGFLQASLSYTFALRGAAIWLGVVIVLAAMASFLPARSATHMPVREVLNYE